MPTMQTYIEEFAKEVGPFAKGTAKATASTTTLTCEDWPFKGHNDGTYFYRDQYLWIPSPAGTPGYDNAVRFINTYAPTTGVFTPDVAYTADQTARNFQIHGVFDPINEVPDLINHALMRCMYVVEVSLIPSDNLITRFSLATAAPWLEDPTWVVGASVQGSYASYPREQYEPSPIPYEVVQDGPAVASPGGNQVYYLHIGRRQITDKIYLKVLKPAYYMTSNGAGFSTGNSAVAGMNDTAPVPVEWLKAATLVEAWRRYEHVLEPRAAAKLAKNRQEATAWFTEQSLMHFHMPSTVHQEYELMHWGPSW